MPKRKPELYQERRQQIIDGALEVFSTKGFSEATNKDIANAAGINSAGLIYHYFESKEDLLRAVIESYAPPMRLLTQSADFMSLRPEQALTKLAELVVSVMNNSRIAACQRILIGEAVRSDEFAELLAEVAPLRITALLAAYLEHKMDEGLLQRTDSAVAAVCFLGPLFLQVFEHNVLRTRDALNVDAAALAEASVRIFLHGLQGSK